MIQWYGCHAATSAALSCKGHPPQPTNIKLISLYSQCRYLVSEWHVPNSHNDISAYHYRAQRAQTEEDRIMFITKMVLKLIKQNSN
jgi:hypothetical protein